MDKKLVTVAIVGVGGFLAYKYLIKPNSKPTSKPTSKTNLNNKNKPISDRNKKEL